MADESIDEQVDDFMERFDGAALILGPPFDEVLRALGKKAAASRDLQRSGDLIWCVDAVLDFHEKGELDTMMKSVLLAKADGQDLQEVKAAFVAGLEDGVKALLEGREPKGVK